jgi:choline dehydrogenase-like flavoprotein
MFFVVGGGSAGCVLANRLSKRPSNKILVLEEGGDPNPLAEIPATFYALYGLEPYFKTYETVPQGNACLATKKVFKNLGNYLLCLGYSPVDSNIKGGKRWEAYNAFLKPALGRPNLSVYRYARAIKVSREHQMHVRHLEIRIVYLRRFT